MSNIQIYNTIMDEINSLQIPNEQSSSTPAQLIKSLHVNKRKFLSRKKIESEKKVTFQEHQIISMKPKKQYLKTKQFPINSSTNKVSQEHNDIEECQTSNQFNREKIKINRTLKRKNQKLGTVIIDKDKPYFDVFFLKDIIKKNKIKSIVKNFANKIKRVSVKGLPVQYDIKQHLQMDNNKFYQAIQMSPFTQNMLNILSIFHIVAINIISSLSLVFVQCRTGTFTNICIILSFLLLLFELFRNLGTVKYISGKKIKNINKIWRFYPRFAFFIDVLTILITFLNIFSNQSWIIYISSIVLLKIPNCLQKIQKVEAYLINNLYNQQYWSMAKIFISNFVFAHVISILLAAMTHMNTTSNWMAQKNILYSAWHQRYIWSYYWGNTIMLTVGFGDLVASNSSQALCLIFIQTFSCFIFAYNINCIGNIMHNIRAHDAENSKKTKIFKKLAQQNDLPEQISWKINNYITQNAQIKKRFNFEEQRQFIVSLPTELKKQYHKESNKKVFEKIQFFKSFVGKTLYNLAQTIQIKISHPQQIIQSINDNYNLLILKIGQIAFTCKRFNLQIKELCMDKLSIKEPNKEAILNLDFIIRKRQPYEIKSLQYTIYYFLGYDKFIETIKQNSFDYEYLCTLRDKIKNIPDQFQVFTCQLCEGNHLKLNCPKLHFIPYHETVISRQLYKEKTGKNGRLKFTRDCKYISAFVLFKKSINHFSQLMNIAPNKRRNRLYQSSKKLIAYDSQRNFPTNHQFAQIYQQTEVDRQIKKISQKYKNVTNQIIKEEINKLMKHQQLEDEVWNIKLDQMTDFNNYFPLFNPSNIKEKYEGSRHLRKNELMKLHTEVILNQLIMKQVDQPRKYSLIISEKSLKDKKLTV